MHGCGEYFKLLIFFLPCIPLFRITVGPWHCIHVRSLAEEHHTPSVLQEMYFHQLPRSTVYEISQRIASQWKSVGRLLGLTEDEIMSAASSGRSGIELRISQDNWADCRNVGDVGRRNGHEATLLKLKNAIQWFMLYMNTRIINYGMQWTLYAISNQYRNSGWPIRIQQSFTKPSRLARLWFQLSD